MFVIPAPLSPLPFPLSPLSSQEIDAFQTIQRMLIALLDTGNNAGAKKMVSQIISYWQQRAKVRRAMYRPQTDPYYAQCRPHSVARPARLLGPLLSRSSLRFSKSPSPLFTRACVLSA